MPYGTDQLQRPAVQGPGHMAPMHAKDNDSKKARRRIIAGVAAAGIAVGAYGVYASTLTVTDSSSFAAGTGTVASGCDSSVTTVLNVATAPGPGTSTFPSSGVSVDDINYTECYGKTVYATALSAAPSNTVLASGSTPVSDTTTTAIVTWTSPVTNANEISTVAVIIQ